MIRLMSIPHRLFSRALCAIIAAAVFLSSSISADDQTVICFVSHKTSHGFGKHEYAAGCRLIGEWLTQAYPDRSIETRYSVDWPTDPDDFFKDADSVVFFCTGKDRHLIHNRVPEFDKVMRTGAGLACLHYAVHVNIGPSAKGMLAWMGGYFEDNWSVNPHWVAGFNTFADHPAASGLRPFEIDDEWYFHMRFVGDEKGITPILSTAPPESTMERKDGPVSGNPDVRKAVATGKPQHVAWAYQRGEDYNDGRGFGFTGLHYHWNFEDDNFRRTVLNGVAWTAGLDIPESGIESPRPTRSALEANIIQYGGEQDKNAPPKPKKKAK